MKESLLAQLLEIEKSNSYPFHMPGHKRNASGYASRSLSGAMRVDVTETPSTDDLFHAEGILLSAQKRANDLYRAGIGDEHITDPETFYLTGGSSAGVMASVSCAAGEDAFVIADSSAHRSFFQAAELMRQHPVLVESQKATAPDGFVYDFAGALDPEAVRETLQKHPEARALFVTSPTYEGVVQDIASLSQIAREADTPLIVDEAHGALFSLHEAMPKSALAYGADLVNHSTHKTMSALTQTALLHVQGHRIDRYRLRHFLDVYQSSSPSYVLMASIDEAVNEFAVYGKHRIETLLAHEKKITEAAASWKTLRLAEQSVSSDPCKVVIAIPKDVRVHLDGFRLSDRLRTQYALETERAKEGYVICMLTPFDTEEGVFRLIQALQEIDQSL